MRKEQVVVFEELDRTLSSAAPEDRPALALALSARLGSLTSEMLMNAVSAGAANVDPRPAAPISADQAAAIAGLPIDSDEERARSRRRIYSWSKGQPWAGNPTGKCLRINESRFRKWLDSRKA